MIDNFNCDLRNIGTKVTEKNCHHQLHHEHCTLSIIPEIPLVCVPSMLSQALYTRGINTTKMSFYYTTDTKQQLFGFVAIFALYSWQLMFLIQHSFLLITPSSRSAGITGPVPHRRRDLPAFFAERTSQFQASGQCTLTYPLSLKNYSSGQHYWHP